MINNKKVLLLDMNGTFMFGEDRFGQHENYFEYYQKIGGKLEKLYTNQLIQDVYDYLDYRYSNKDYMHCFPSVKTAVNTITENSLHEFEVNKIITTFAFHELGTITDDYVNCLHGLNEKFTLAVVIDIWSPKTLWLEYFKVCGIDEIWSAVSFSSDHGFVKPSAKPYFKVLEQLNIRPEEAIVIGDRIERDLEGAEAAGIECILLGEAYINKLEVGAIACYKNLLEFYQTIIDVN